MSEMAKTVAFVVVAAASLLLGFVAKPGGDNFDVEEIVGERLNQFEVDDPKRLKIVKFDQDTGTRREFEVANDNGLWTIPSKQGYPADAAKQMAEAATCLIDRQILGIAATSASEHQELGVIDPSSSNLGSNSEGVGIRVTMTDSNDKELVDMIIGKTVKDAKGQHFVRNTDQDVVYVVELNSDKLSTQFEDWIEDDLLQLNSLDIREVQIKDYSAALQPALVGGRIQMQVSWDRRAEIVLDYDNSDSKWTARSLREFNTQQQEFVERKLADDEELNEEALTGLRNGLDELLIVDVERKPKGLSADLKAGGDFLNNNEAINSLVERGFAPLQLGEDTDVNILSSEGEVICTLDDGVEYVLRFGNLKMDGESSADASPAEGDESEKASHAGIDRYLFLMARLNEGMIKEPELDELPELPEDTPGEPASAGGSDGENKAENDVKSETSSEDESKAEESTGDSTEDVTENPSKDNTAEEEEKEESDELKSLIAARKTIENENQRRLAEYQDKIEASKERVQQLNDRFGDWYYVISDDVYKKIHLSLDNVIRKKEKEEGEKGTPSETKTDTGLSGLPSLPVESSKVETKAETKEKSEVKTEVKTEAEAEVETKVEAETQAKSDTETAEPAPELLFVTLQPSEVRLATKH